MTIETSGRVGSVAIAAGEKLLQEESFSGGLRHAGELLPTMERLVRQQGWQPGEVEQFYVSAGPGSFTGIRIAITVAKTLSFAQSIQIVPVCSIEALALNAENVNIDYLPDIRYVAVVLEAGRKQIFGALFEKVKDKKKSDEFLPGFRTIIKPKLMKPEELLAPSLRPLVLLGEGLKYHPDDFTQDQVFVLPEEFWQPHARNVHRCGWLRAQAGLFAATDELEPFYLRRPEAVEKWEKLHRGK